MKKYRVRTNDGKIYGPLKLSDLVELMRSGIAKESAQFQTFPIGDWSDLSDFPEISDCLNAEANLTETELSPDVKEEVKEEVKESSIVIPKELEEMTMDPVVEDTKAKEESTGVGGETTFELDFGGLDIESDEQNSKDSNIKVEDEEEDDEVVEPSLYENGLEKTRINYNYRSNAANEEYDKTVIRSISDLEEESEGPAIQLMDGEVVPADQEESDENEEEDKKEETKISFDEETVVVSSDDLLELKNNLPVLQQKKIDSEIAEIDNQLDLIEKKAKKDKKEHEKEKKLLEEEDIEESGKKKKSMFLVIFLVFLFIYLDEDEKKVVTKTVRPIYSFPIQGTPNLAKSAEDHKKGLIEYKKGGYTDRINASALFFSSLANKFEDNPAIEDLILVYSDLLPMAKDKDKAAKIIYKLVSLNRSKIFTNDKVALGASQFYYHMWKVKTAIYIIESYLRLNKPKTRIYSFYLKLLIEEGKFSFAKKAYESLLKAKKSYYVVEALASYMVMDQRVEDAIKLYQESYKDFSESLEFLAAYGNLLIKVGDFKTLKGISAVLVSKRGNGSPKLFAEGLKFAGYVLASEGSIEEASRNFAASLVEYPSREIKDMLSSLEVGGGKMSEKIIKISKIDRLISLSKVAANELDWDKAFFLALDAVDIDESNKNAKLYLSSLQAKRGYLEEAELTLSKLLELYPEDEDVNYHYLDTLIMSFKFKKVKEYLSTMTSKNKLKSNAHKYFSILAKYFLYKEQYQIAIKRYKEAIRANPIEEDYLYSLAKIYCKLNKYKSCRNYLNEARSLNPLNIDYKVLHSTVLFELEGLDVATGYLLRELEEQKDDPKLVGQLAILSYRNQNYNEFKEYKERLEGLSIKDEGLYRFLIETSKVEDNYKMIIENARKLLLINPGDIQVRMELAKAHQLSGDNRSALVELEAIAKQLPTYPNISYEKALIYLSMNKLDIAESEARNEIKVSNSEYGYYILGKVLMEKQEFDEAELALEKANSKRPKFFENLLELGYLKYRKREFAAARELYLRAMSINPVSALLAKRMGDVFKEIGQATQAVEQYKKYLQISPNAPDRSQIEAIIRQLQ